MFVWLAGWTLGGGLATFALLWMYVGLERLLLRPDAMVIARELNGREVYAREYAIGNISNLRVVPNVPWEWGFGGGKIAFDYGARTFRFGAGIDEAEARDIVSQMQSAKFPLTRTGETRAQPRYDRIALLSAQWRNLLMVNFAVDPAQLRHLVPAHTELDSHDGSHT